MFGIGLAKAYGQLTIDALGGLNAAFLYAVFVRIFVGLGWFFQFRKAGKNPLFAFVPIVGPYMAFRLVWDDFSLSFIFASTTLIAFIDSFMMGQSNGVIKACAVINFVMWWIMALLTMRAYGINVVLAILYGGVPWLGTLLAGLWPAGAYVGPWSSDPNDEQNLTTQQRKTKRKKAAKAAKAKAAEQKRNRKKSGK